MKQFLLVHLFVFCALSGPASGSESAVTPDPVWVLDPANPGENLPSSGRSLFDRLFASARQGKAGYDLPFPFAALLARLDAQLRRDPGSELPPAKRVLIPLGRSLQRTAAAPEYFAYPRVVVAVDSSPAENSSLLLKDRLYIGYQEKSDVLEVISYNESAARFEFQLVRNYRAGSKPEVVYANRTLCYACHQNGAPIFSRALWDETNANPQVAALLTASGRKFYGISPDRGVDVPYAIDIAVKRANNFALTQRLWREACGADDPPALRCRAGLFSAALRLALADGRKGTNTPAFNTVVDAPLRANAARLWPGGLTVGGADLPNRNPLQGLPGVNEWPGDMNQRARYAHVPARFEPLAVRRSQDIWRADASDAVSRLTDGLAEFVADSDRRRLAKILSSRPADLVQYSAPCRFEVRASRWSANCLPSGGKTGPTLSATLEMNDRQQVRGRLDRMTLPDAGALGRIALASAKRIPGELASLRPDAETPPRSADGNPLSRIAFRVSPNSSDEGQVLVEFRQEFPAVEQAVAALAEGPQGRALFGANPFPREAIFSALFDKLGAAKIAPCCQAQAITRPPRRDAHPAATVAAPTASKAVEAAAQPFYPYCATCHQGTETFPPNFLSGTDSEVSARLHQCAPRLFVRLAMADLAPEQRDKTPMPPESLLPAYGTDSAGWRSSPIRAALLAQVGNWLRAESGHAPSLEQLLAGGYEALRPCLPQRLATNPSPR